MQAHACDNNPSRKMNMTANHALPMSQNRADALRREWVLLLKMGQPMDVRTENDTQG